MKMVSIDDTVQCPLVEIALYIDGELSASEELDLEAHLSQCQICVSELNRQKSLIRAIETSLSGEIELPANFTRRVVARAESSVGGLRSRGEWLNAAFIFTGLLFFALFSLGADAERTFGAFFGVFESIAAVASLAGHVLYDIALGGVVVLRTIGSRSGLVLIITAVALSVLLIALGYFRKLSRINRA